MICRSRMQPPTRKTSMTASNINGNHSSEPTSRRNFTRRFALCGDCDTSALRALRKAAETSELFERSAKRTRATAKPTDILFSRDSSDNGHSPNRNDADVDQAHQGNIQFQCIIHSYYFDMYQFAPTATHRSIVRSAALDDLKSRGYSFLQSANYHPSNLRGNKDEESFYVMDDADALEEIKRAFRKLAKRSAETA